jgi:hypothetical protein
MDTMENYDEQEQRLLIQLANIRKKKEQQKVLLLKEKTFYEIETEIKNKNEIINKVLEEINKLQIRKVEVWEEINELRKQNTIIENPIIENPIIENPIIENPIIENLNIDTLENAKKLNGQQLKDYFEFSRLSVNVSMSEIKEGDYIRINGDLMRMSGCLYQPSGFCYNESSYVYGMVSRKTDKSLFFCRIQCNDKNKILTYDDKINNVVCYKNTYFYVDGYVASIEERLSVNAPKNQILSVIKKNTFKFVIETIFDCIR